MELTEEQKLVTGIADYFNIENDLHGEKFDL